MSDTAPAPAPRERSLWRYVYLGLLLGSVAYVLTPPLVAWYQARTCEDCTETDVPVEGSPAITKEALGLTEVDE